MIHDPQYIGWFCTYTPIEIIEAAGFIPYGIKEDSGAIHEDVYLGDSICPYVRICLGGALTGTYDFLYGVVISHSCECMRRLYDAWDYKQNEIAPQCLYFLDIPKKVDERSVAYFAMQLKNFKERLEQMSGAPCDEELPEVIREYNKTRLFFHKLFELMKSENPPLSGTHINALIQECMKSNRTIFNKKLGTILESLDNAEGYKGPRIMVYSAPGNPDVIAAIEEAGGVVVYNNSCSAYRFIGNPVDENGDPLFALARSYLEKTPCPRMLGTIAKTGLYNLKSIINDYRIDGVIYYSIKFCANLHLTAGIIKNEHDFGVPIKIIEGDISSEIDRREIYTFIKSLMTRKTTMTA
ncbi:MAG: 2-hydroxyacyl-CoA dehydratase family protein [Spirochaetota bacterium]|nr:2-hydroxyacyl-CoA dehydratase family protein [Spirochaetota bacterium]